MVDEKQVLDKIDYVRVEINQMYDQHRFLTPRVFNYLMDKFEEHVKELAQAQQTKELEVPVISW